MKRSKHFKLLELLPQEVYIDEDNGWDLLDERILVVIDWLKELVGNDVKLVINNWNIGGSRNNCGYRSANCTVGARYSRHKRGMAVDIISRQMNADELRLLISRHMDKLPCPVRIEKDVNWLHIDVDNDKNDEIYWFKG